MLEDIGFDILHCSLREKSYDYSKQSLKSKITRQIMIYLQKSIKINRFNKN